MNSFNLTTMPSTVVFTTWLQHLLLLKRASFSSKYDNVILLNTGISSMFAFGRHIKTNHPLIAAPRSLIPWFFMGKINAVIISNMHEVFIQYGENTSPFFLGIRCSPRRINCLTSKNESVEDLVKTIDLHGYVVISNNVEVTKPLNRAPVHFVSSLDEIIPTNESEKVDNWNANLTLDFDIYDTNNFDHLKDPLAY